MISNIRMAGIDPELEAFIPLFPRDDLTDPVAARKALAGLAAAAPVPGTAGMEIEDRTVPADPDVPVRIYRPHRAQGAIVQLHGGGFVMGDLDTRRRPGADRGRRSRRRRGPGGRGGVAGPRRAWAADPLPAAQPARAR
jgi:acetyl esterase/lipase